MWIQSYLDQAGLQQEFLARRGPALALQQHGTISLERALQPAVELAEKGFIAGRIYMNP